MLSVSNSDVNTLRQVRYKQLGKARGCTECCSWLRRCATSQKVADSIPDGVINPSVRSTVLGSTHTVREMSTRDLSLGVKGSRCLGLTTLPLSRADFQEFLGSATSWIPGGLSRSVVGQLRKARVV